MRGLQDKTVIVTGGGGGIGGATCRRFGEAGARVAVFDINAESAAQTAVDITTAGGVAQAFRCDITDYAEVQREALRLAGPGFMRHFKLGEEPGSVRQRYGGEFGQRSLLARRLVQAGVRFIEVSHNLNFINGAGWDTHNAGQLNQHILIRELDNALSALISDLQEKRRNNPYPIQMQRRYLPVLLQMCLNLWFQYRNKRYFVPEVF